MSSEGIAYCWSEFARRSQQLSLDGTISIQRPGQNMYYLSSVAKWDDLTYLWSCELLDSLMRKSARSGWLKGRIACRLKKLWVLGGPSRPTISSFQQARHDEKVSRMNMFILSLLKAGVSRCRPRHRSRTCSKFPNISNACAL